MAEFARNPTSLIDPRRAYGLARRAADGIALPALTPGLIPPQILKPTHVPHGGVLSTQVDFANAIFAYDASGYTDQGVTDAPGWSKIPNQPNDLRAYIGPTDRAYYAWCWSSFTWANGEASQRIARFTLCLYDSMDHSQPPVTRSTNTMTNTIPNSGGYRECVIHTFLAVPADDTKDWNIGLQGQFGIVSSSQSISRQTHTVFLSAQPSDGSDNTTLDGGLG